MLALVGALGGQSAYALELAETELGLLLGAGFGDNDLVGDNDTEPNPLIGFRYGLRLGNSGFNFFSDFLYGKYDGDIPAVGDSDYFSGRVGFELNVMERQAYNSFISIGFGVNHFKPDNVDDFTRGTFSVGLGQAWGVGRNDSLRWEARLDQQLGSDIPLQNSLLTQYQVLVGYSWGVGAPLDSDADGIPNRGDQCPNTPAGAEVDSNGCPLDSDMDGVFNGLDKCPGTPAGVKVDSKGCPLDRDGDGINDDKDQCPDTPAPNTADGCLPPPPPVVEPEPAPEPVVEAPKKRLVLKDVFFDFDSAKLRDSDKQKLDGVAASLGDWGRVRIEVGGYTDSMGSETLNKPLSQARAEAVRAYLVSRGIEAERLEAVGYGSSKPIASNKTISGRVINRRVELTEIE
jgi:OOP family OmpA-OmpF porin